MSGPIPNMVEFDEAVHHAKHARSERQYARESRQRGLRFHAKIAEESARYHESQVRAIAALAIVTGSAA